MKKKIYYCKESNCENTICYSNWKSGSGFCRSCANKGERNPSFKTGYTILKHYCIVCDKEVSCPDTMCSSCATTELWKNKEYRKKVITKEKYAKILTKDFLIKEYTNNKKSAYTIAKQIKCNPSVVYTYLRKHKIKIRHKQKIEQHYCIEEGCNTKISDNNWRYGKHRCPSCAMRKMTLELFEDPRNHPRWIKDRSLMEYGDEFDSALKEAIRQRDGYKCQECGCTQLENGRQLDVHHIDYDKKHNTFDNLIALCHRCHMRTNGNKDNRNKWTKHFQDKLKQKLLQFHND